MNCHYVYKITNIITKEYYIGVRTCKCKIEDDPYMGSSSVWNKDYIKANFNNLHKEIIKEFKSRKEANDFEVLTLKKNEDNKLCVNQYFDYTPDLTGTHQTLEHINKRKMCGEKNGMYGKHHTLEARKKISQGMMGKKLSEKVKLMLYNYRKGAKASDETRLKISKARSKIRYIINIHTNEVYHMSISDFIRKFPDKNFKACSMRKACEHNYLYNNTYRIYYEAYIDDIRKSDEIEGSLNDNLDGSVRKCIEVLRTAND